MSLSTKEYCNQMDIISNALIELGIKVDDKIGIVTEWHILDMALLQIGAVSVPLYATLSSKDYEFILNHSDSKLCLVLTRIYSKKCSRFNQTHYVLQFLVSITQFVIITRIFC